MEYAPLSEMLSCLTRGTHLHVGVLFFGKYGNELLILPHEKTIHPSPVCEALKADERGYARCFYCRNRAIEVACRERRPFGGLCINGAYEYTHPVTDGEEVVCIIYVGNILIHGKGEERLRRRLGKNAELLSTMERDYSQEDCRRLALVVESYIRLLLLHAPKKDSPAFDPLIENIKRYVLSNIRYGVSSAELTRVFHYNEKYLGRLFKRATGMTLHEFINEERLSLSERLLLETDDTVLSISERVGFNNVTYFNRLFRARHSCSPSEYRRGARG